MKKLRKVLIVVGGIGLSLFGGVMTSYAVGPGEVNTQTVAKPEIYNQQLVKALGNWEQQGSVWKFKGVDGAFITNAWIESLTEAGAYYYVTADGVMLVNSQTPDGYTVDGSGVWRGPKSGVTTTQESSEDRSNGQPQLKDYNSSDAYYEALANWMLYETDFMESLQNVPGMGEAETTLN